MMRVGMPRGLRCHATTPSPAAMWFGRVVVFGVFLAATVAATVSLANWVKG